MTSAEDPITAVKLLPESAVVGTYAELTIHQEMMEGNGSPSIRHNIPKHIRAHMKSRFRISVSQPGMYWSDKDTYLLRDGR